MLLHGKRWILALQRVIIVSIVMSGTGRVQFNHGDINSGSTGAVPRLYIGW